MKKVLLKRSSSLSQGQPVLPTTSDIEIGELAINYATGHETISMKNANNQIVKFSSDNNLLSSIGLAYDSQSNGLFVKGLGNFDGSNMAQATPIQDVINDNEYVTAEALNALESSKLDASAATGFVTSAQVETQITGKNYVTSGQVETQITGKNYATVSQIPNVGDYFDGAEYDSATTRINFKHGNTVKAYIDAAAFIKDGMVSDVAITTPTAGTHSGVTCLVVSFNTDAGQDDFEIPLSDIFDPNNYYTKAQANAQFLSTATTIPEDILIARYGQPLSQEIKDSFVMSFDDDTNKPVLLKTADGHIATYFCESSTLGYIFCDVQVSSENEPKINYYCCSQSNNWSYGSVELLKKSDLATATSTTYGVVKAGNFIGINANGIISAKTGTTNATLAVGNHTHSDYMTSAQVESQITEKGYITGYTETDPTVPSWAKQSSKPTYTASEVGALATGTTLDGISDGTTRKLSNYSLTSHTHTAYTTSAQVETQITGKGYITGYTETDPTVPAWAKTTNKPTYTAAEVGALSGVTVNGSAVSISNGVAQVSAPVLPTVSASDNGKVMMVVNGAWSMVMPSTVYTGENTPLSSIGNDGDIYLQTE